MKIPMKRLYLVLTLLVIAVAVSFLLRGFPGLGQRPNRDLLIVAAMPLSGPISYLGQQELAGLALGVQDVNARGGVGGRPLKLVSEDTQGQPKNAVTIAQKYASNENVLCFVVTTSKAVKAVAPILEARGIPLAGIASDPDLTSISPVVFRPYMSFETEARLLAGLIQQQGWTRVAFVRGEDEVFSNEVRALSLVLPDSNKRIVADETYQVMDRDFRLIFERVASAKPQVIVALGWGFEVGALLEQKRLNQSVASIPLVGGYAFLTEPSVKGAGDLLSGTYVVAFEGAFDSVQVDGLRSRIQTARGFRPGLFLDFAATYDVPFIIMKALSRGEGRDVLLARVRSLGLYQGVAGVYRFEQSLDGRLPLAIALYSPDGLKRVDVSSR